MMGTARDLGCKQGETDTLQFTGVPLTYQASGSEALESGHNHSVLPYPLRTPKPVLTEICQIRLPRVHSRQ